MQEILTIEEFKKRGLLKEGAWFELELEQKDEDKLENWLTGYHKDQIIENLEGETHFFRYTKQINDGREVILLGEISREKLVLGGITGSRNATTIINAFCRAKFGIPDEVEARSINMKEQGNLPDELRYGKYWLPETYCKVFKGMQFLGVMYWENGIIDKSFMVVDDEVTECRMREVRPVIWLKGPNVRILVDENHNGKKSNEAYSIVILKDPSQKIKPIVKKEENLTIEEFARRGLLKEGAWFKLHLNSKVNAELRKNVTGYSKVQTIENKKGETWLFRFAKELDGEEEEITLLGEPFDCDLYLSGKKGYEVGNLAIKSFCNVKFGIKGKVEARSITWKEQTELPKVLLYGQYWLPEQYRKGKYLGMQCVIEDKISYVCLYIQKDKEANESGGTGCDCNSVRPVISLYGNKVRIIIGKKQDGETEETAYDIEVLE